MSEAGDSIHSLSSCTHIGASKTECKYKISLKSAYLYTPTVQCTKDCMQTLEKEITMARVACGGQHGATRRYQSTDNTDMCRVSCVDQDQTFVAMSV